MLTPIEIENQQFKKKFLGYSAAEVDEFLERVFENYEKLYKENIAAKERISVLSDAVKQYKTIEETLQNTLVVAQSAGDEVKRNAYEKAENIIKDAETRASEIISGANNEVSKISYKYEEMKGNIDTFRAKIISLLKSQLDIAGEFKAEDNLSSFKAETPFQNTEPVDSEPEPDKELAKVEKIVDDINEKTTADIPKFIKELEAITRELPKIEENEYGEFVVSEGA